MTNDAFRCGLALTDVNDEPHDQVGEVEAPVESVGERAEVAMTALSCHTFLLGSTCLTSSGGKCIASSALLERRYTEPFMSRRQKASLSKLRCLQPAAA